MRIISWLFLFFLSLHNLQAFNNKDGYEIHISLGGGPDPSSIDSLTGEAYDVYFIALAALFEMREEDALSFTLGKAIGGISDFDKTFNYERASIEYVKDFNKHRISAGVSYHFNINVDVNSTIYPVTPHFENSVGWMISYKYYFFDINDFSFGSNSLNIEEAIGFNGLCVGLKYEYIQYEDTVSSQIFSGSSLAIVLDMIF